MDYRELLKKYMLLIDCIEDSTYLYHLKQLTQNDRRLRAIYTKEEFDELIKIESEINGSSKRK